MYQREQDKPAVSLLLNWFRQLAEHGRVPAEDYAQLDYVYRSEEEVRTMLAAALERDRKNIYDDGFVNGEAAGLASGMQVQRQTILQLLEFRFSVAEAEQKHFVAQLEQIQTLEQLSQLTNCLLNRKSTLADFIKQLTSYLPTNQAA